MRIHEKNQKFVLSCNTSRVNRLNRKHNLEGILNWIIEVVNKIQNLTSIDSFIDIFAEPIDFQENLKDNKPVSILFTFDRLYDDIDSGNINRIYYLDGEDEKEVDILKYHKKYYTLCGLEQKTDNDRKY
ncbi:MAG: hypothetical protein MUE60_13230, partial [Candidatus Eisenbacteria bacterium]|nr:hypothetical protein [Candidatus Eisenbacteria bacterium]